MTHPIIPPPELVQQWADMIATHTDTEVFSAAAQWGADQELEACCQWLHCHAVTEFASGDLRAARRPKPPSLKQVALLAIDVAVADERLSADIADVVRRALEQPDD